MFFIYLYLFLWSLILTKCFADICADFFNSLPYESKDINVNLEKGKIPKFVSSFVKKT